MRRYSQKGIFYLYEKKNVPKRLKYNVVLDFMDVFCIENSK